MLKNKENSWKSNDTWKFTYKGDKMSIENIKKKKVLGTIDPSGEFVKKNVKSQQEYEKLILFQCKDGN